MKYPKSHELLARARGVIPGGINSNIRALWEPHPMFYERGEGSRVWDADGNEFIDYVLGRGPLLLGHSPAPVIDAVVRELRRGLMFAGQSRLEIEAAEAVARHTPCAERVRFTTSGSEAVHAALRLARAATGRQRIIRFESHYHGWFDNIAWSHAPSLEAAGPREQPTPVPVSEGMPPEDGARLIVLPWNDLALVERAFDEHPGQIAAIITEPMLVNGGAIEPLPGYLERLRTLCDRHGTSRSRRRRGITA